MKSASIKRLLSQPALAAGLTLSLASTAPAAADFFGIPDQPRFENSEAGPTRVANPL